MGMRRDRCNLKRAVQRCLTFVRRCLRLPSAPRSLTALLESRRLARLARFVPHLSLSIIPSRSFSYNKHSLLFSRIFPGNPPRQPPPRPAMHVRKIIESYEKEFADVHSNITSSRPPNAGLRVPRLKRPSLRIVTEDEHESLTGTSNTALPVDKPAMLSTALFTPDSSHTFGRPNPTSVPFPRPRSRIVSEHTPDRAPVPPASASKPSPNTRRLQRYARDESALRCSLHATRPERSARDLQIAHLEQATALLGLRALDAQARLQELHELLAAKDSGDNTGASRHQALLKERWMEEHRVALVEEERGTLAKCSAALATKTDGAPVAMTESPTQVAILPRRRRQPILHQACRRMTQGDVELPLLRSWPFGAHLKRPFSRTFPLPFAADNAVLEPTPNPSIARTTMLFSHTRSTPSNLQPVAEQEDLDLDAARPWSRSDPSTPCHLTATTTTNRSSTASSLSSDWAHGSGSITIYCLPTRSKTEILAGDTGSVPLPDYFSHLLAEFAHFQDDIVLPIPERLTASSELSFKSISRVSMDSYDSGVLVGRPSVDSYHYTPSRLPPSRSFSRSIRLSIGGRAGAAPPATLLRAIHEDGSEDSARGLRRRTSFLRYRTHKSEEQPSSVPLLRTPPAVLHRVSDASVSGATTGVMERVRKRVSVLGRGHR
ncbi:hypothetical protein BV25DRAFT_1163374 [Artomyces pyxidatus]|uniref:Uncharacterized protein n=1 Tax=Artomyces pyxidatus TaxID=48021 RepID=A0ACB8SRY6_9AGAM|nr:hypothetical protein BV25DRAFT_1163374 [Artomyces pyxidatus]